jgi:hypothetical protein
MMTQVIQKEALPKKISASFKNKEKQWKKKSSFGIEVPKKKLQQPRLGSQTMKTTPFAPFICMCRVSEEQACKNLDSDGRSCDESPDYMDMPFYHAQRNRYQKQ